jgi:hypothetical protein
VNKITINHKWTPAVLTSRQMLITSNGLEQFNGLFSYVQTNEKKLRMKGKVLYTEALDVTVKVLYTEALDVTVTVLYTEALDVTVKVLYTEALDVTVTVFYTEALDVTVTVYRNTLPANRDTSNTAIRLSSAVLIKHLPLLRKATEKATTEVHRKPRLCGVA